tara:strand:- start:12044 stop:15292 length:3249 start_codon:yes stop_codon:yes gene_type:complete
MSKISTIPLEQIVFSNGKNTATRFICDAPIFTSKRLISSSPFIVETDLGNLFISNNDQSDIPDNCQYALLNSRMPKKNDLTANNWNFQTWLKHPLLTDKDSESITQSWNGVFAYKKEDSAKNILGLRPPQIGAIHSVMAHLENADDNGIVVLPTGTGKTETMISVLVSNQCPKVLVSVPSVSLRTQISHSFKKLGILRKLGVIPEDTTNPIVGVINSKFKTVKEYEDFVGKCNVVITTMQILSKLPQVICQKFGEDFSHYFVDEAHHSEAPSWRNFIETFPPHKVFLFTATPFRNDNKKIKGKIIFNFSLRKAQEQGYYKKINFIPIREYDTEEADKLIAKKAVEVLTKDRENGLDHILMARCKSKIRAEEIYEYYKGYKEFNPVVVYTGKPALNQTIEDIKQFKHQIIICVDMLGEGFDLPQLKLAAIHDERQSIPVMLQFIGRFTRTSGTNIGDATFITNTAYPPIKTELNNLYNLGSDWNVLLPSFSDGITQRQVEFNELLDGFQSVEESQVPFHSINPAMSAVVFSNKGDTWNPNGWKKGITGLDEYEHQFSDVNESEKLLVIVLGKQSEVDWVNYEEAKNLSWDMIAIYWDYRKGDRNLIFVNSTFKNFKIEKLLTAIFGSELLQFEGEEVFRVLDGLKRYTVYNFGGRIGTGKDISFQSFFGKNVEDGLHQLEQNKLEKNNVFGVGYRGGESVSMGCSQKGKIWSYLRGNLKDLMHWCQDVGTKLLDDSIDTNTILSHTIKAKPITKRPPNKVPVFVDWHPTMYSFSEGKYTFTDVSSGKAVDLSGCELNIVINDPSENLTFKWQSEFGEAVFELVLSEYIDEEGTARARYKYNQVSGLPISISYGQNNLTLEEFFQEDSPIIYFHDTSYLYKSSYRVPKDPIPEFDVNSFIELDWSGIDTSTESMGFNPIEKNSVQYHFIEQIKDKYDLIYNDDNSGEMADIVAIKMNKESITLDLYHLKYAKGASPSSRIDNFYEVCGQAQKSLKWKHCERRILFDHLFKRLKNKQRIIKGDEDLLESIQNKALWDMELIFNISIVQPGLSRNKVTDDISILLANTSYFLKATGNINLEVYISS